MDKYHSNCNIPSYIVQSFGHNLTKVNILGPCEYVGYHDTMHVFHCMDKMVTGGNKLYIGQLCPSGFL